jgi:hypothetical protein
MLKTTLEAHKIETEKIVQDMKRRHAEEIAEMVSDNHAL